MRTKVLGAKPPGDQRAGAQGAGRRPPAWCGCGGRGGGQRCRSTPRRAQAGRWGKNNHLAPNDTGAETRLRESGWRARQEEAREQDRPGEAPGPWGRRPPHLSLLLSAVTSRPMASLLSVASSSSRCSFLRLALMRWDSSSASSSCRLSCLTFALPFSACRGGGRGQGSGRGALRWPPGGQGPRRRAPAPCTARRPCARPPPAAAPPSASCPSASATWRPLASLCTEGGVPLQLLCVSPRHLARGGPSSQPPLRAHPDT